MASTLEAGAATSRSDPPVNTPVSVSVSVSVSVHMCKCAYVYISGKGNRHFFQGQTGSTPRAALRAACTSAGMRYSWPPRSGNCMWWLLRAVLLHTAPVRGSRRRVHLSSMALTHCSRAQTRQQPCDLEPGGRAKWCSLLAYTRLCQHM